MNVFPAGTEVVCELPNQQLTGRLLLGCFPSDTFAVVLADDDEVVHVPVDRFELEGVS